MFRKVAPPRRDTVVFDLDGTLVDSAPDIAAAMNDVLGGQGRRALSLDEIRGMVGDGTAALVARAFAAADSGEAPEAETLRRHVAQFRRVYEARATEETRLYPGVLKTVRALDAAGYRMGLCTNKPDGPARAIVEALGLAPFIRTLVGGESAPARKPDPRHLEAVLAGLEAGPEAAVMVGDGANDVMAARALSVPVVLVAFGFSGNARALDADAVIERFDVLGEALARLEAA